MPTELQQEVKARSLGYEIGGNVTWRSDVKQRVTLYAHAPVHNDDGKVMKEIGQVVSEGTFYPEHLIHCANAPIYWFAWAPGKECLEREFVSFDGNKKIGGFFGCQPCRDRASGKAKRPEQPAAPPEAVKAVPLVSATCPQCNELYLAGDVDALKLAIQGHITATHPVQIVDVVEPPKKKPYWSRKKGARRSPSQASTKRAGGPRVAEAGDGPAEET